jgi:hypothetical protein
MFRFIIRDMLWLTALVAMGAAWWADRVRASKALADVESQLKRAGWPVLQIDGNAIRISPGVKVEVVANPDRGISSRFIPAEPGET